MVPELPPIAAFRLEQVLADDARQKTAALLGSFDGLEGRAVLLLARQNFDPSVLQQLLQGQSSIELHFLNDVYSKWTSCVLPEYGRIVVDLIFPATEKHISKYKAQKYLMVRETAEQYQAVTEPYINSLPPSRLQWVYNILDGKAESERVLFRDADPENGFVLLPDQKWDQSQVEDLYLQAIVARRKLHSVRDLRSQHTQLLEHIREQSLKVAWDHYRIRPGQLRLWLHYPPSYYHLHVHVAHTAWTGAGAQVGKAILLEDVIENLANVDSDFYSKRTMTFVVGENDPLLPLLRS